MGALAMSETTAGSDVVAMKTKADKNGIDFQQCCGYIYLYKNVMRYCDGQMVLLTACTHKCIDLAQSSYHLILQSCIHDQFHQK